MASTLRVLLLDTPLRGGRVGRFGDEGGQRCGVAQGPFGAFLCSADQDRALDWELASRLSPRSLR